MFGLKLSRRKSYPRFVASQSGNVAIIFALSLIPLVGVVGAAIDYTNLVRIKSEMQNAADSAVLAAAAADKNGGKKAAREYYAGNTVKGGVSHYDRSESDVNATFTVRATHKASLYFMHLFGIDKSIVSVEAKAVAPKVLSSVRFRSLSANGWYNKLVKLMVRRRGETEYEEVANVEYHYQPTYVRASSSGWIDLGDFEEAYLQMDVDPYSKGLESCRHSPCDLTYRTDDPNWSHRLIIDRVPVPPGTKVDILSLVPCGTTTSHAWEDGGSKVSYADADFYYEVEGRCDRLSSERVRLIE